MVITQILILHEDAPFSLPLLQVIMHMVYHVALNINLN